MVFLQVYVVDIADECKTKMEQPEKSLSLALLLAW
jgi:hypothetical protein